MSLFNYILAGSALSGQLIAVFVLASVAAVLGVVATVLYIPKKDKGGERAEAEPAKESATEEVAADRKPVSEEQEVKPEGVVTEVKEEEKLAGERVLAQAEEEETETEEEEVTSERLEVIGDDGNIKYIVIKYSKSFQAKLIQSAEETKGYYSALKNELLSYGLKSRMSWKWETFRIGRKTLAKFRFGGKTLSVLFALPAERYAETKYKVEDYSDVGSYADTPCLYRIKNDRRAKYANDLIKTVAEENGLTKKEITATDYAVQYPYETTDALVERKLIKVLTDAEASSGTQFMPAEMRKSVTVKEAASIMPDEIAATFVEESGEGSDRTKTGIINIDVLSENFADGEIVTLEEIKARVKGFDKKITYLKVLARGKLDKKLTVKADAFSMDAVKMIVITGGAAIKK